MKLVGGGVKFVELGSKGGGVIITVITFVRYVVVAS